MAIVSLVLPCITLGNGGGKVPKSEKRARYSPPQPGEPRGWIDLEQYNLLDDVVEAGRLLMFESQLAGIDIDDSTQVFLEDKPVYLPGGKRASREEATNYIRSFGKSQERTQSSAEPAAYLVNLRRAPTLRERGAAMSAGIRFSRRFPEHATVMAMRTDQVLGVAALPYVRWIQPFRTEFKSEFSISDYAGTRSFHVESIVGDQEACRSDLTRCGAEIVGTGMGGVYYSITMKTGVIDCITSLWWVIYVEPVSEPVDQARVNPVMSTTNATFQANDSRRLVSAHNGLTGKALDGTRQLIGMYEAQNCYTLHAELNPQLGDRPSLISDLSVSDSTGLHGAFTSGICVGKQRTFLDGSSVAGVATGAQFVSWRWSVHGGPNGFAELISRGAWIVNNSYTIPLQYNYDQNAQMADAAIDQHGGILVFATGNNTTVTPKLHVESPSLAKNCIAVGAISYVTDDFSLTDRVGLKTHYNIAGPTRRDGRLKPDLVAPGGSPAGGTCSSYSTRGVVSCTPVNCSSPWTQGYTLAGGTSAAAPHVTGTAAICASWLHDNYPHLTKRSEIVRAALINSAIPLRGDAFFPPTVADTARAFANTDYGFGLVNAYSGLNAPADEYKRLAIFEGSLSFVGHEANRNFTLAAENGRQPIYLVATMVYNDVAATLQQPSALQDSLVFWLRGPDGDHPFLLANNCTGGSTVQKIMIPRPKLGIWDAVVRFAGTNQFGPGLPAQDYAVVVDVVYQVPHLDVQVSTYSMTKAKNEPVEFEVTVRNIGGGLAAGVTAKVVDPTSQFYTPFLSTPEVNTTYYLDNLVKHDSVTRKTFHMRAPSQPGSYDLTVEMDLINRLSGHNALPLTRTVHVQVNDGSSPGLMDTELRV